MKRAHSWEAQPEGTPPARQGEGSDRPPTKGQAP